MQQLPSLLQVNNCQSDCLQNFTFRLLSTARHRSCGKVIFSVVSVCQPFCTRVCGEAELYRALSPPPRHVQSWPYSTGTSPPPTCSNLLIIKHVRLPSGQLASYWILSCYWQLLLQCQQTKWRSSQSGFTVSIIFGLFQSGVQLLSTKFISHCIKNKLPKTVHFSCPRSILYHLNAFWYIHCQSVEFWHSLHYLYCALWKSFRIKSLNWKIASSGFDVKYLENPVMSHENGGMSAAATSFSPEHKTTHSHRREITCDPWPLLVEWNGRTHTTYWQLS